MITYDELKEMVERIIASQAEGSEAEILFALMPRNGPTTIEGRLRMAVDLQRNMYQIFQELNLDPEFIEVRRDVINRPNGYKIVFTVPGKREMSEEKSHIKPTTWLEKFDVLLECFRMADEARNEAFADLMKHIREDHISRDQLVSNSVTINIPDKIQKFAGD